jgi:hypothetical protein
VQLYGVSKEAFEADRRLLERRLDLAHSAAVLLDKNNLIKYDRRSGNFQVSHNSTRPYVCMASQAATLIILISVSSKSDHGRLSDLFSAFM